MKRYILKSNAGLNQSERPLDDFTEEDYKKWLEGKLPDDDQKSLQSQAEEDQEFEWWIEEE